jgi:hypothetical protein
LRGKVGNKGLSEIATIGFSTTSGSHIVDHSQEIENRAIGYRLYCMCVGRQVRTFKKDCSYLRMLSAKGDVRRGELARRFAALAESQVETGPRLVGFRMLAPEKVS